MRQVRQEARKQAETAAQEAAAHELALMRRQLASAQSALARTEKVRPHLAGAYNALCG